MDRICPKSATVYITQMIVAIAIVAAAIINLSIKDTNTELWLSLLCSTIGYVMPSPSLKKHDTKRSQEQADEV